jgi:hypothetical protein
MAYGHETSSGHKISVMTNLLLVIESMYIWSMVFLKFGLGFFFLRLIKEKRQRWLIYGVLALTLIFSFIYFNITIFQCGIPGNDLWILRFSGKCLSNWSGITYGFGYTVSRLRNRKSHPLTGHIAHYHIGRRRFGYVHIAYTISPKS